MALTLLLMAAILTVFANISGSVTRRRATIEMASSLQKVREVLARDLAGATCPAVPWQRPESNVGYLEIIEGPQNDYYPTPWIWFSPSNNLSPVSDNIGNAPGIDLSISTLPGSNLGGDIASDEEGAGLLVGSNAPIGDDAVVQEREAVKTDGRGLGDADDILMLTVRSEREPFVGRIPKRVATGLDDRTPSNSGFDEWHAQAEEVESPLAEVAWFAVENPVDPGRTFAFGEPGYRTIYRRALLILPDLDYGISVVGTNGVVRVKPGVVRVLPPAVTRDQVAVALAALVAFQDRYDLSVRLEWDPTLPDPNTGRWVLRANTLGDLTKPENRYEHHGYVAQPQTVDERLGAPAGFADRYFPYVAATGGITASTGTVPVVLVEDPELTATAPASGYRAVLQGSPGGFAAAFEFTAGSRGDYPVRPFVFVNDATDTPPTARAILDEDGRVVHITTGLVPLGGDRRGDDIMMTDALALDLRVYDPGAPRYAYYPGGDTTEEPEHIVAPGDPAWATAYYADTFNSIDPPSNLLGDATGDNRFVFDGQGAYVDLAYGRSFIDPSDTSVDPGVVPSRFGRTGLRSLWALAEAGQADLVRARFFSDGLLRTAVGPKVADVPLDGPGVQTQRFAAFDTWSWHYETNGVNEDGDRPDGSVRTALGDAAAVDEGSDGLESPSVYYLDTDGDLEPDEFTPDDPSDGEYLLDTRHGPDDYAERETRPPYDSALRGLQVTLRTYERDSRQIREVRVRESFVPE